MGPNPIAQDERRRVFADTCHGSSSGTLTETRRPGSAGVTPEAPCQRKGK